MSTINFGEFRKNELTGTNGLLNEFMRAFDLPFLKYMSYSEKKVSFDAFGNEIRDYHNINEAGQKFLLEKKGELQIFSKDYYEDKSSFDIAKRINLSVDIVFQYLLKRAFSADGSQKSFFDKSMDIKDFNKESKVKGLSSFQILRDIQVDERFHMLKQI